MARARQPRRGEVWAVRFDPSVGAEIRKLRPAVVGVVTESQMDELASAIALCVGAP